MKILPVKGTRDFYPPEMAVRNWIIDGWKKVSVRNGFEEYDGPIFEYLKMFQIKSGDEIVEQLFSLRDRGGRDLAMRPEITPTLARMVNQRINSLPKPIKWFSVPRLFRAERPQKGRLREFFQWNIDIIGEDSPLADAEVIFTTVDYLREIGLTSKDIKVKISSRELLADYLISLGIPKDKLESIYVILDKKCKLPPDTFEEILGKQIPDKNTVKNILDFMSVDSIPQLKDFVEEGSGAFLNIKCVLDNLDLMGAGDFCLYDPGIVRGLAYYTGIVFEVHDVAGELRAICGGGRYDNLLHDFGGPKISATGMGMGDCVLEILLKEKALLQEQLPPRNLDYFVACVDEDYKDVVVKITMKLRSAGFSANFSYKITKLGKQLKQASEQNAAKCIIIGDEFKDNKLTVKNMTSGQQELVDYDEFLKDLKS
ncbi:MAG: histidine--tRNA ligase [Planctomycetes bacterium]|nr:histidine--tRNA ligase [Planctomycetota bacterium]